MQLPSMPTLRISQWSAGSPDRHRATLSWVRAGESWPPVDVSFTFALSAQEREEIRWYLEDFLQHSHDPTPKIAARIERQMEEIGERLFRGLFESTDNARDLCAIVRRYLADARIEVLADTVEASGIPWELMRDPRSGVPLAVVARAFVRGQRNVSYPPLAPEAGEKVRVLLAICRPRGGDDVPFRSVASHIVCELKDTTPIGVDLDVLRPPTFEALAGTLRRAKAENRPYSIVHFDGHGIYEETEALTERGYAIGYPRVDAEPATVKRGFLLFEDPDREKNRDCVDGFRLGALLRDTGVPVLILNACQSAFAEASAQPRNAPAIGDARAEIAAYGSLAQTVLDAGVSAVVAMRYAVYVTTAARFVSDLYQALAGGQTIGEAVSAARKSLADNPERENDLGSVRLQDWSVPIVWEQEPFRFQPQRLTNFRVTTEGVSTSTVEAKLPLRPELGFFGRDETLYALDRAFDRHRIVLLHAYAGAGKTSTAVEFARWYERTGGVSGAVLFSSFEYYLPLDRLLDSVGEIFSDMLAQAGMQWGAISGAEERQQVALQVLRHVPVLWIWDNIESVAGFPAGTPSNWSDDEQHGLRNFLHRATAPGMQAKFLLTSRRYEQEWLGDLPVRVAIPPMKMYERRLVAAAVAERHGTRLAALPDLTPLLQFTDGNPMTVIISMRQALFEGIRTVERLVEFVGALRAGAVALAGADEAHGRDRSLAASLSYGFDRSFTAADRNVLGLLHLFQGWVDTYTVANLGNSDISWSVETIRGLTLQHATALLNRAAEIGLLTAAGGTFYRIHPALPWYFRELFETHHSGAAADGARRAFAAAISALGNRIVNRYIAGNRWMLDALKLQQENLRSAAALGSANAWRDATFGSVHALWHLYILTGQLGPARRLLVAIEPTVTDPAHDGPAPGLEEEWALLSGYQIEIARRDGNLPEAVRLLRLSIARRRQMLSAILDVPTAQLNERQKNEIRNLAVDLRHLGVQMREQGADSGVTELQEALGLMERLNVDVEQADCALSLGSAYLHWEPVRDLDVAEYWFKRSLELRPSGDSIGLAQTLNQIGILESKRFEAGSAAGVAESDWHAHLERAFEAHSKALELLSPTAFEDRAKAHDCLGMLYVSVGDYASAIKQYDEAIRCRIEGGDRGGACGSRGLAAFALYFAGRLADARAYAEAALRDAGSTTMADRALDIRKLIADIDRRMTEAGKTL